MNDTRSPDHLRYDPELPATEAQELLFRLRRRATRRRSLWNGHLAGFVAINTFLAFLDFVTGGGLWFPYVTGAMAIPFAAHAIFRRRRELLENKLEERISEDPGFPDRMFRPFRKLHRSTTHFLLGLSSAAAISGYLLLINIMTGGPFWAAIPAASIALPVVFHALIHRGRRESLIRSLESGGDDRDEESPRQRRRAERRHLRNLERQIDRPAARSESEVRARRD